MNNFTPQYPPANGRAQGPQQQLPLDLRHRKSNGAMSVGDGKGPVAVPNGMRNQRGNGYPANMRGMTRGGAFDGPRSPPGSKSERLLRSVQSALADTNRGQILLMCHASSSGKELVKPAKPVLSCILQSLLSTRRHVNTSPRLDLPPWLVCNST